MSRSTGVDVITGEGLDAALDGAGTIIDAATGPSPDEAEATAFFTTAAAQPAGGGGAGRGGADGGRLDHRDRPLQRRLQRRQGRAGAHALAGPIPVHIVRAAQFHEFVSQLVDWGRQGDVSHVWKMRTQLVAARAVAEVVVDAALAADFAPGAITEVAGPREESLEEAARLLVAERGEALRIEAGLDPSVPDAELYASGGALPGPGAILTGPAFADWLRG